MRACTSSNSFTFWIAITAWSAKVCSELDLAVGERAGLRARQRDHADRLAVAQQGNQRAWSAAA